MKEEPETWGIRTWTYDVNEPQIELQGYPFALNLNIRLLWFVREFLDCLNLESDLSHDEVFEVLPTLERLTNPPLDDHTHSAVRIMSVPLPD